MKGKGMVRIQSVERFFAFVVVLVFVFFVISPQELTCEVPKSRDYRLNKEFLIGFGNDVFEVVKSPGSWESKDWWRLTAVLGTGGLLYAFDEKIHDWSLDRRTPATEDWAKFGSFLGNGVFLGGLITTLYLGGEIFDERGLRKTALLGLESWLTAGAFVLGLKAITGRSRPYTELGAHYFKPFSFSSKHHSLPSGHAASIFAVAAVIADQTEGVLIDVVAYSLSTLAAFSRVHESKHWPSDVFIGAAIGYFIGKKICSLHREHGGEQDKKKIQLGFFLRPNVKGLTINFSW
jgi:membrane-associated phospholipid phosphatase